MSFFFNPYALLHITTAIISLLFGLFVFFRNRSSPVNQMFLLWCLVIFCWLAGYSLCYSSKTQEQALIFAKIACSIVLFSPSIYYYLNIAILKCYKELKYAHLSVLVTSIVILLTFFSNDIIDGTNHYFFGFYGNAGRYYFVCIIIFFLILTKAVSLPFKKARDPNISQNERLKCQYLLFSFSIAYFASVDFLPKFKIAIYPFGAFFILLWVILMSYAILKHDFIELKYIYKKGLVYSVLLAILSIVYFILVLTIERFLQAIIGYKTPYLSIVFGSIIAVLFIPLRNWFQLQLDRHLFLKSLPEFEQEHLLMLSELKDSEKFKTISRLSSSIAHDIKSPLTAIKTYFEYFPQKKNDPQFLEDFQRIVGSEISRINDLTNNLLEFAKPSPLQLQPTNINALLERSLTLLHHQLVQNKINIIKNLDSTDSIQADPNKLTQAFLNLILNAIEAMPNGGIITISTKSNKDQIEIEIQDTGIGIPEKDFKNIFKPFFTQKEKGTGLGLAIVEEIIKNHNGAIKVKSVQGKGTTFRLVFKTHINL